MSIITFNSNSHERDVVVTNLTKFSPAIFIFFLLTACGGGGSGDQTENPIITETPVTKVVQTGILLDSPISNIQFSTSSALEGKTDSSGSYKYIDGDKIVFSIGDLKFPEITAKKTITPLEIFVGTKTTSAEVINFIRLIQTMDDDGDIDHEITLTDAAIAAISNSGLKLDDFYLRPEQFEALPAVIDTLIAPGIRASKLISTTHAIQHFNSQLTIAEFIDSDADGINNALDSDDDNDGTDDNDDAMPFDPEESSDFDLDNIGDNQDNDDDNDGIEDAFDSTLRIINDFSAAIPKSTYIVHDSKRNLTYLTHKAKKTLSIIDTETAELIDTLYFSSMPERMVISPDGDKLYVAILLRDHSSSWWTEDQSGSIAIIDLNTQTISRTLSINTDPYDLVVTSSNKLIVTSGSGQWTSIYAYDATTGIELGRTGIRQASRLSLHPSEDWVFAADTDSSPSDIEKFDISGTGITSLGDSPYHGDYRMGGNVWSTPDGRYVITRGGDVFLASDMTYVTSLTSPGMSVANLVFDETEKIVIVTNADNSVSLYNLDSLEFIKNIPVSGAILSVHADGRYIYIVSQSGDITSITKELHPCSECGSNTAPIADFSVTPLSGNTNDTYTLDAGSSIDTEDGNALSYRWDIDNDGVYDTSFSSSSTYDHVFALAGTKFVRLQTKDSGGLTDTRARSFDVAQGTSDGTTIDDSIAFKLQFTITDIIHDQVRNKAYITDKAMNRLYIVDLNTGYTKKYFQFPNMPERMAITPDGSKLYVALLTQEHSSYWWKEDQNGFIAVLDLETEVHTRTFAINTDPYDLVVTSSNKLIVASGSGQWTSIHAYDVTTGTELGKAGIRQASRLSLHPSENWVFAADTDSFPSDIEKFDISGIGINALGDSPYHGDHRMGGNVWPTPDGNYVITRGGDVFLASDMTYVSSLTATGISIDSLTFDETEKVFFVVTSDKSASYYNSNSLEFIATISGTPDVRWILPSDSSISILSVGVDTVFNNIPHPCSGCGSNTVPTANFTYTPLTGDTSSTYTFDAGSSSDNEDGNALNYRWDIDNDGIYDTAFSPLSTYDYKFTIAGIKTIRLQVKDSAGLTDTKTINFNVIQGLDTGTPVSDSIAFDLGFETTAVRHDKTRNKLYITDKSARRLYMVDLATGLTERYFQFSNMPERMTITPDGSKLYVALLVQEHNSTWWKEDQSGYIAVLDLDSQTHFSTFAINTDPYDLAVNSKNKLIVTSGSGQWTYISAYDATDGTFLGAEIIYHKARVTMHPSQNQVLTTTTGLSPAEVRKFDISGPGITVSLAASYSGGFSSYANVWSTPDGKYAITHTGDVFLSSDMTFVRKLTTDDIIVKDLSFDTVEQLIFITGNDDKVYYFNSNSLEVISDIPALSPAEWIFISGDTVSTISSDINPSISQTSHPCPACGSNTAPVAAFTFSPLSGGDTTDVFTFDGSGSNDSEDGNALLYRWDIDNDGSYDTSFSPVSSYDYQYAIAGTKVIHLQVKDSGGLVNSTIMSIDVSQGTNNGTMVSDSTAYQLAFAVTDVQIDRTRNKAYITDKNAKRLYVVNLETGLTEKYFQFTFMPERMTVSPDGNKLFVALLAYDHSYTWWDKDQFGYIGTIDLELQAHTNTFLINIDPYDIVVNSSNKLIVASGSGQWTMIYAYDASDGSVLGSTGIRQKSRLSLHPSGNWVFAANTDSSPSDIEKFDISGIGITLLGDSPDHGDYRMNGNVWVTPDGNYVITRGGDIFLSSDMTYVTGLTATGTNIQDLSFDNASGSVSIIGESFSSSFVYTYDLTDWSLLSTSNALSNPQYLMMTDSLSYLLSNPSGTPVIASPP